MGGRRNQVAQSAEAIALWHELWSRMRKAEAEADRLRIANTRLRALVERAEVERTVREVTDR